MIQKYVGEKQEKVFLCGKYSGTVFLFVKKKNKTTYRKLNTRIKKKNFSLFSFMILFVLQQSEDDTFTGFPPAEGTKGQTWMIKCMDIWLYFLF